MPTPRPAAVLLLLTALCLPLALPGCARRQRDFREAYARTAAGKQGEDLLAALVALDQEYPRELSLKVNLGALYLAAGDLPRAAAYLERGEALAAAPRFRRDRRLGYLLQANLSEHRLRAGRPDESVAHAERALATGQEDDLGVVFTRAKARLAAGEPAVAVEDFAAGRAAARVMNLEDYGAYIRALVSTGRVREALGMHEEQRRRFGYVSGQGLAESLLYERAGRPEEALLSAFLELEQRRGSGAEGDARIRRNLAELSRRLEAQGAAAAVRVVEGLDSYVAGDWGAAQGALERTGLESVPAEQPHPALRYLLLALRLEQGAAPSELDSYLRLEPELRTLAAYYYHFWRGLRRSGGAYGFAAVRPLLEKTILLGPGGGFAEETRGEIARLLGLSPAEGRHLLLGQEAQALVRRAAAEQRPEALEPVLAMLGLPDTPYTPEALLALQQAAGLPALRRHLELRKTAAEGRLRERLVGLLGQ